MPKSPTKTDAKPKKPRKKWWKRKRLWVLVVLLAVPGGAMVVVTRTDALKGAVLGGIESSLGCEAQATSVRMTWDGRLVITDLRLIAPGVQETAAQFLLAPKVVASVDWGGAVAGSPRVTELSVISPQVRVSQHAESGALNLSALRGSSGDPGALDIPRFTIVDGRLEFGEHGDDYYTPLPGSTLRIDGSGERASPDTEQFNYVFEELDASGHPVIDGTTLTGSLDLDTGSASLKLSAVDLFDWSRRSLPSSYQPTWESLAMTGRIPEAAFHYAPGVGMSYEMTVESVAFDLPVDVGEEEGLQLLSISDADGTVSIGASGIDADVTGFVEDLPVTIRFHADEARAGSPFRVIVDVEDYRLERRPDLLPFAPRIALKVLERFGGPTCELDLSFAMARDADGELEYTGTIDLRDGEAAFEEFPYPVTGIDGRFTIDRDRFRCEHLTGRCLSGGTLEVKRVTISPPGDGAEVIVEIAVRGVPLDEVFRDAMPESRRALYEVLFDEREYERLRDAGVLRAPGDPDNGAPVFALGGLADLDISVHRPLGEDSHYATDIDVRIAEAGFVPIGFPYPIVARDVVLDISPREATVRRASLRGLTGMAGSIEGSVRFPRGEDAQPDLTILATGMPIDGVLAQALPAGGMGEAGSPRDALLGLGLSGSLDGSAHVARTIDGRIGFEVRAELDRVASSPEQALRLGGVTGSLRITRDTLEARDLAGTIGGSTFAGGVDVVFARPLYGVEPELHGLFDATDVDLSAPFEDLAGRFDEAAATALMKLRSTLAPEGRVDASLSFDLIGAQEFGYALDLAPRSDLRVRLDDERWVAKAPTGTIRVTPGSATFGEFEGEMGIEGGEQFTASLDGVLALGSAMWGEGTDLRLRTSDARLDSRTVRTFLERRVPAASRSLETLGIGDADFDSEATITSTESATRVAWSVRPSRVLLDRAGSVTETDASGIVRGVNGLVILEGLTLGTDTWSLTADGQRTGEGAGVIGVSLHATEVSDGVLSLLPDRASEALRGIGFTIDGSFALENASLHLDPSEPPRLRGALRFDDVSARIGVPILNGVGTGSVDASEESFELDLYPETMRVARIGVTDGHFRFVRHKPGADLLVPVIEGRVHDGLLIGRCIVRTSLDPETYELSAELASVRFGDVLKDLGVAESESETDRGRMDAGFALYGRLGDATARRGRATVRVQGGRVLDLPGVIPLLELSNLQAPANEEVDLCFADVFVAGERALVDRVTLFSDSLRIAGTGHVRLDDLSVDLSFSTYGARYVPILSPLLEGLREEFASTRVTGTLGAPEFRTEQLRSTRALLDAIAGPPEDAVVRSGAAKRDEP